MKSTREKFLTAIALDNYEKVQKLLSKPIEEGGADVNWTEETNEISALILAINNNNYKMVKLLLDKKADPNAPTYPYRILKEKDPVKANQPGSYPLHEAVKQADVSIIKLLLKSGANPNLTSESGQIPSDLVKENRCFDKEHAEEILNLLTGQQNDQSIVDHAKRKGDETYEENTVPASKKVKFTLFNSPNISDEKEKEKETSPVIKNKKEF